MSRVAAPHLEVPREIVARLESLRRRLRLWLAADGLSRALLVVTAWFLVSLLLDWWFRFEPAWRVLLLAGGLAWVGWVAFRRLVQPLATPLSDEALCLRVEAFHRGSRERIITALELAKADAVTRQHASPALVQASIEQGSEAAGSFEFGKVLNEPWFRLNVLLMLVLGGFLGWLGWSIAQGGPLETWFRRNVLLATDVHWPQQVYLEIEGLAADGSISILRGDDRKVFVRLTEESQPGIVPEVMIDFRPARGRPAQAMRQLPEGRYETTFSKVLEEFQFRARGADAYTPWAPVRLVEPPGVEELELEVTPPAYAAQSPQVLPPGRGPYYLLQGSTLALRGTANKDLASARLVFGRQQLELAMEPNRRFSGRLAAEAWEAGVCAIELIDTEGHPSRRPASFTLRIQPDAEPRVHAQLVGISTMIVPTARVPFLCRVTDDFGITDFFVDYSWREASNDASGKRGEQRFPELEEELGGAQLEADHRLEATPWEIPPGAVLSLKFVGVDNDDVSGPKQGTSAEILLKVVTEEELRGDLLRREKEQRQDFEQLLKSQQDLLVDTQALAADSAGDRFNEEQRQLLMKNQRLQKLVGSNTGTIADRFSSIILEIQNNGLEEPNGPLQRRLLSQIIEPMREVADGGVPAAVRELDRARRLADDASERNAALEDALARQEELVNAMEEILRYMVKSEGYQEAVNLLYEIMKSQQEVFGLTEKEKQERIRQILEGGAGGRVPAPDQSPPFEQP